MTARVEQRFEAVRAQAVREIRPPGVEAAVRTNRHRRSGAAAAWAVLVTVGGPALMLYARAARRLPT